jgi:hypothetical protein
MLIRRIALAASLLLSLVNLAIPESKNGVVLGLSPNRKLLYG